MHRLLSPRIVATAAAVAIAPGLISRVLPTAHSEENVALDPNNFKGFKLKRADQLTHDTKRYTFDLEREHQELGLTVASCLVVKADVDGETLRTRVQRALPVAYILCFHSRNLCCRQAGCPPVHAY
jgi:hypothetical protein